MKCECGAYATAVATEFPYRVCPFTDGRTMQSACPEARRANKDSKNTCAVQKAVQVCPALAGVKFLCHHCVCHLLLSSVVCDTSKDARSSTAASKIPVEASFVDFCHVPR